MTLDIREHPFTEIAAHAAIAVAYRVDRVLRVEPDARGPTRWTLREESIQHPYTKDFDAIPGNHPMGWADRFDTARWGILAAYANGQHIGGAVVVPAADHTALLWDLRVSPSFRRTGVASALWAAAVRWAAAHGCDQIRVETQDVNVPACRFYQSQGCQLESVEPNAYPDLPAEVCLIWCRRLPPLDNP